VLPGVVGVAAGIDSPLFATVSERLNEGVVAVAAASLLFLLPTNWPRREFTLRWSDAAAIDWGTILLFGSGIVFGALLRQTGLAEGMGRAMAHFMGVAASVAVVVPIVLPVAAAAGVSPLVPGM